jgi:hypothetical protein
MKVKELVILVKYGQGLVLFDSFVGYMEFLQPPRRQELLSEMVDLILKLNPRLGDIDSSIKISRLHEDSTSCILLRQGLEREMLQQIICLPNGEFKDAFKLLLSLFTLVYKRKYALNKNDSGRFWYWDFSATSNILRLADLNKEEIIDLNKF